MRKKHIKKGDVASAWGAWMRDPENAMFNLSSPRANWEAGYRARAAEPPQPASVGGVDELPKCPHGCVYCQLCGFYPKPAAPPHPSNEELALQLMSERILWLYRADSQIGWERIEDDLAAVRAFVLPELERRLTVKT